MNISEKVAKSFKQNEYIYGYGMFDKDYYCDYVSEALLKYLGNNVRMKLSDAVHEEDKEKFYEAFKTGQTNAVCTYIRILTANSSYRMCRMSVHTAREGVFKVEITDIENICESYKYVDNELDKLEYLIEKQGYILFEYFYDIDETVIYVMDGKKKIAIDNDDSTYSEIKKRIQKDAKKLQFQDNRFVLYKKYIVQDIKYFVKGNVIVKDGKEQEIIGSVTLGEQANVGSVQNEVIHDAATGLFNKPHSLMLARKAVGLKKYSNVSLVMLDIDDFKLINDSYGHIFGDEVIKQVAYIIRETTMNRGFSGRFGGDEFFMVLYNIASEGDLRAILQDIYFKLQASFADRDIVVTCTMGIAEAPRNGTDFDMLMKKADKALYIGKYKGKNRYIIYKEEIHGELEESDEPLKVCAKERLKSTTALNGVSQCLYDLENIPCVNFKTIEPIMNKIMYIYKLDGISIYYGDKLNKVYEYGKYNKPFQRIDYMNNRQVLAFFSGEGVLHQTINYTRTKFLSEFHGELKNHDIVTTTQYIIGDKNNIKGLITYDSERNEINWAQDEIIYITLFSKVLSVMLWPDFEEIFNQYQQRWAYIEKITQKDCGCEELQEASLVKANVTFVTREGKMDIEVEDKLLAENGLYEGSWISVEQKELFV